MHFNSDVLYCVCMKRVFIIHGWMGYPEEAWFPWLKSELQSRGIEVRVPQMPNADEPNIDSWVPFLAGEIGSPDNELYLVGHSIGVQTILRYLETIDVKVGGVIGVAGFYKLAPDFIEDPEDAAIAEPWLKRPMDDVKIRETANKIVAFFSDNDPYVPIDNEIMFKDRLGAETYIVQGKGHMGRHDMTEAPQILEMLLKMMDIQE